MLPVLLLFVAGSGQAATIDITIDTSAFNGQTGQLAFDLIDGGPPSNSITLSQLAISGGTLGTPIFTGGASALGSATFLLIDSSFFNEVLIPLTIGTQIGFRINSTDLGPTSSSIPDSFTTFLLDSSGSPLFPTTDPTGADALLQIDAGVQSASVFSSTVTAIATPEPSTGLLIVFGSLAGILLRRMGTI
jgi:hypothetical protein